LADCATTSHVANKCSAFTEYKLLSSASVASVGNTKVNVVGRRTVELVSEYRGVTILLVV
jgi:hypothetical protein